MPLLVGTPAHCSPLTRGWSRASPARHHHKALLPAHAGMAACRRCRSPWMIRACSAGAFELASSAR
ncbi:hypothetical protein EAO74_00325 [Streptomyces sp. gb1(2016)]|uniref:Uncharacterized protein n=1 Tax=Streptomyces sp. gb1(2016) TaxID=1828321 RepID=A0A652LEK7_9ACTN|nr:hypothetical protein EAO74_00325 [Streptomyces sp. gb1(2016)]